MAVLELELSVPNLVVQAYKDTVGNKLYKEAITNKDLIRITQSSGNSLPILAPHYQSMARFERTSKVQNPSNSETKIDFFNINIWKQQLLRYFLPFIWWHKLQLQSVAPVCASLSRNNRKEKLYQKSWLSISSCPSPGKAVAAQVQFRGF